MAKDEERRSGADPQVAKLLQRQMGKAKYEGRGKPGHAGQVGMDKTNLPKATYRLSLERQALVRELVEIEDVSLTDIVEAAVVVFYNAYQDGAVDLADMKKNTRSLKVSSKLEVPDDFRIG